MDIISHALWTNLVFKELPLAQRSWAVIFGVLPDFISFSFLTVRLFLKKTIHFSPPLRKMPAYVYRLYKFTHSLVVWLGVFFIFKIFQLDYLALIFCGWGFHILLDIFTHTEKYFPTPILWPFSSFHFSGINWPNKWFMLFNYLVLTFLYLVFYF